MKYLTIVWLLLCPFFLQAQETSSFWIKGQIRPRVEFRNGYKTLQADSSLAYAFVEQRSRLTLGYKSKGVRFFLQAQDVRNWGSTPLINSNNGFFTLFQGWGQVYWGQYWSLKIGRQVWSYDNQRILGGLDWAAQGRAHDGLLLQYKNDSSQLELQVGAAYNSAANPTVVYNIAGNYKTLQFVRVRKAFKKWLDARLLLLNIGQERVGGGLNWELTAGGIVDAKAGGFAARVEGYYQGGNWGAARLKQAFLLAAKFNYTLKPLRLGLGGDWLSGTNEIQARNADNSFNPWLGTNHIFYGHLDYFYVGSSHGEAGLIDAYAEAFYTFSKAFKMGLMYHYFQAPSAFTDRRTGDVSPTAFLGHELDFIAHYKPRPYLKVSFGYAHLFGALPLETLKPTGEVDNLNNWAWLMVDINLELFRHQHQIKTSKALENQRF